MHDFILPKNPMDELEKNKKEAEQRLNEQEQQNTVSSDERGVNQIESTSLSLPPSHKKLIIGITTVFVLIITGSAGAYFFVNQRAGTEPIACSTEAKICPDGSAVGRTGLNCEFAECPILTTALHVPDDWQTYRNEKYGFEFRYPSDWNAILDFSEQHPLNLEKNLGAEISNRNPADTSGYCRIGIGILSINTDLDTYVTKETSSGNTVTEVTYDGKRGIRRTGKELAVTDDIYFLLGKTEVLNFSLGCADDVIDEGTILRDNILKTLNFNIPNP